MTEIKMKAKKNFKIIGGLGALISDGNILQTSPPFADAFGGSSVVKS